VASEGIASGVNLLFDENLSFRLVQRLAADLPDSARVAAVGVAGAPDAAVWEYAAADGYTIATNDDDFRSMGLVRGESEARNPDSGDPSRLPYLANRQKAWRERRRIAERRSGRADALRTNTLKDARRNGS
jgi:hypothetical protein